MTMLHVMDLRYPLSPFAMKQTESTDNPELDQNFDTIFSLTEPGVVDVKTHDEAPMHLYS